MGHRHTFNTGQMFDPNDERNWKHVHPEQPYGHFARAVPAENSSLIYPIDNMSIDTTIPYGNSHWNSTPFPTTNPCVEMPHHQPDASGPSHNHFMPLHQASSSNYGAQTFNRTDDGLVDLTSNVRGTCKRKSPDVPSESSSSSRCYNGATFSDQEKQNMDSYHTPWDTFVANDSSYVSNNVPVGALRNVRSRASFEGDNVMTRTNLSTASSHQTYMAHNSGDLSCPMEYMGQSSDAQMRDWGHFHASHPAHGRSQMPDANTFGHEPNSFILGGHNPSSPTLEIGQYHSNNLVANRNPIPQNLQGVSGHSSRGNRSDYTQRSPPVFRGPSSSNVHWVHSANEEMQMGLECYPPKPSRPLSTIGWRSNDRSARTRISSGRFCSISHEPGIRSRLTSEGLMIVDRSGMYGTRGVSDQHNDMRLDVDNMSYEELLALGERIGNVSTGLSEDLISKCLTESVYCSPVQDEERCVICLEDYKNMDDVGTLRKCGHDFHVGCIKKWLIMKNLCPICKASAAADQ